MKSYSVNVSSRSFPSWPALGEVSQRWNDYQGQQARARWAKGQDTYSYAHRGSQSLWRLSPRGFFVLTTLSSSRLPRPHGFFILVAASSSRLLRPHDFLVLVAASFSRLPRSQELHVRSRPAAAFGLVA